MRTKTVLLTAALSAAGLITALAQGTVYSVNVVGYVNLPVPKGYSMIANQLDNLKGNLIADVIPTAPNDSFLYKYNGLSFDSDHFVDGSWEQGGSMTLNPGEGGFLLSTESTTLTFVGEVRQGKPLRTGVPKGISIVSSQVPQAGFVDTDLGYDEIANDSFINQWDPTIPPAGGFKSFHFVDGGWESETGLAPNVAVGESFYVIAPEATNWDRDFEIK